ncbi:hypothetical protein EMIT036CA2_30179 [Chryseobacterium sp. IT-36CA2]
MRKITKCIFLSEKETLSSKVSVVIDDILKFCLDIQSLKYFKDIVKGMAKELIFS